MDETTHHRESIEELAEQFAERYRRGERPTVEEYVAAHPELAVEIRDLFPTLAMIEELAPSDASEPEASASGTSIEVKPLDRIGDFRILREIGRGGMGVVYEAEQESLGRRVALKVLPLHAASDPKLLARFRRESRAAGQLHHTNIVPIFEVGEYGDLCWYAMQFIPGQALDEIVKELQRLRAGKSTEPIRASPMTESLIKDSMARGPELNRTEAYIPAKETAVAAADSTPKPHSNRSALEVVELDFRLCCRNVARIGLQAAEALAYAHARGVIHRDIKPSNLLLDTAGIVWVSDFGLAKTQDHALTETGDIVGTVRYMAPERFRGECDARSDVYSLGVTLYELLTLRPAFDNTDRLKLIESIGKSEPIKPRAVEPQIPRDVETIVLKAIDKDPRGRYATADAMAADLRRYLNDEPIQARRIGPAERVWRWVRRNPAVAGLAAAILINMLIFTLVVLNQKRRLQQERDDLRSTLYASQMNLVQSAYEADNVARALDILQQQPKELRGWEWHYWQRQCRPHSNSISAREWPIDGSMVFCADGSLIASYSGASPGQKTIQVWNSATGQLISQKTTADTSWSGRKPAFSPDGQFVALAFEIEKGQKTAAEKCRAVVWNTRTGQEQMTTEISGPIGNLAFTQDGRIAAISSKSIRFWDSKNGRELDATPLPNGAIGVPFFGPDGKTLALIESAPAPRENSKLWSGLIATVGQIDDSPNRVRIDTIHSRGSIAFSPNRRWLCIAHPDGSNIAVWDLGSRQRTWVWHFRPMTIGMDERAPAETSLAFSPDSTRLAIGGSWGPTAYVCDLDSGQQLSALRGHTGNILAIAFTADGRHVLTAAGDATIKSWPMTPAYPRPAMPTNVGRSVAAENDRRLTGELPRWAFLAVSRDGRLVAAKAGHRDIPDDWPVLSILDTTTGQVLREIDSKLLGSNEHPSSTRFSDPIFSADGSNLYIAAGETFGDQSAIWQIDTASWTPKRICKLNASPWPLTLQLSSDGRSIAIQSGDLSNENGRSLHRYVVLDMSTGREVFSAAVAGSDPPVRRAIRDGRILPMSSMSWASCVEWALRSDGRMLAASFASEETTGIRLWDVESGRVICDIPTSSPTAIDFGVSGQGVLAISATGASESAGTAYSTSSGEVLTSVRGVFGQSHRIAFSPDRRRLAISSTIIETQTNEVKIWDLETQRELMTLRLPEIFPRSLHFSPDGHKLIFLGGRTGVHVWDGTPLPE